MGLLYGRSRKQSDEFVQRTGPVLRREEKRQVRIVRSTTTTDHTVLNVPAGFKLTILQVLHYSVATSNLVYFVRADDNAVYAAYVPASTDFVDTVTWKYEDAPTAYTTLKLDVQSGTLTSTDLNILYALEPAGEGYYS